MHKNWFISPACIPTGHYLSLQKFARSTHTPHDRNSFKTALLWFACGRPSAFPFDISQLALTQPASDILRAHIRHSNLPAREFYVGRRSEWKIIVLFTPSVVIRARVSGEFFRLCSVQWDVLLLPIHRKWKRKIYFIFALRSGKTTEWHRTGAGHLYCSRAHYFYSDSSFFFSSILWHFHFRSPLGPHGSCSLLLSCALLCILCSVNFISGCRFFHARSTIGVRVVNWNRVINWCTCLYGMDIFGIVCRERRRAQCWPATITRNYSFSLFSVTFHLCFCSCFFALCCFAFVMW